jgi:hypothetical protein
MREIERLTATNQGHRRAAGRMSKQSGAALQPRSPNKSSLYDVIQNTRKAEACHETFMRMTLAEAFLSTPPFQRRNGGAGRDRTDDPLLAKQVLSQLSYGP